MYPTLINRTSTATPIFLQSQLMPVWAAGIAIVLGVVCLGTTLALCSAFLCYRRQKTRMRTAEITTIKAPTLHAFNPTT
ncbi:Protein Y47G6A.32 [Aphelenchoides avenae]|nr:Protein Y47G6A.32 [Aphelenchus avenae]